MASPISFGDAYLMASLAMSLGRAFTKGRKSAPVEFREVENQLYSLSAALRALKDAHAPDGSSLLFGASNSSSMSQEQHAEGSDVVYHILSGCEETLKHLNAVVEKYSCLGKQSDKEQPRFKRWSQDVKTNWKKIAWTTEGGDLATLRSQLTLHTNSLNLVLGVLASSQTAKIDNKVDQVATMMKEIHVWFVDNFKDATSPIKPISTERSLALRQKHSSAQEHHFELYVDSDQGPVQICSHASLHLRWKDSLGQSRFEGNNLNARQDLFICQCSSHSNTDENHHAAIAAYGLSSLSFPVRLASKSKTWMLYKATDKIRNRLVSLIMKKFPPSVMREFEETFINHLSIIQTHEMFRRGLNTTLAYLTTTGLQDSPEARVLNLTCDSKPIQKAVETVTFTIAGKSYTRHSIESIQVLHYKSLNYGQILDRVAAQRNSLHPSRTFEVVVFYNVEEATGTNEDIDQTIIHVKHNTPLEYRSGDTTVLKQVGCTGLATDGQEEIRHDIDVAVHFTNSEAARYFHLSLEEMRMELWIMNLQFPRPHEQTMLKLQARNVHTESIHMTSAEILIVLDTQTQRLRLIITSENGCSILSQELASDFFSNISHSNTHLNFNSPTYLVQISSTGVRETARYPQGFQFLNFEDVQVARAFQLGVMSIAATSPSLAISDRMEE